MYVPKKYEAKEYDQQLLGLLYHFFHLKHFDHL